MTRSQDGPVSCSEPAPSPGNFRKNPNRFPSHRRVRKLLLRTDGVRHRNGHKTQSDARRRDEGANEEDTTMPKVIFDMSMSLDGFVNAANVRPEEPLGDGGERLHEWAFGGDERNRRELLAEPTNSMGTVIAGRGTYDLSVPWWGADGPTGPARVPVFVLTHAEPEDAPERGVYTFATDGIERALEEAKAAAGDQDVAVMGGAHIGQQYIAAGWSTRFPSTSCPCSSA